MSVFWTPQYDEQAFRRDTEARDCASRAWEDMQMRDASFDAGEQRCDGSGVLYEEYIDVDQTYIEPCLGCIACELEYAFARKPEAGEEDEIEYRRRVA